MTNSGDAAEQVLRITLDGLEFVLKISGTAAKQIAAFLVAALKSDGIQSQTKMKLKGRETLKKMLKSGKETKFFSIKESDLKAFVKEAKRYGLVYCILKNKNSRGDGTVELMAKIEDSPKINRICENLEFAAVDKAMVSSERTPEKGTRRQERHNAREKRTFNKSGINKSYRAEIKMQRQALKADRKAQSRQVSEQYRIDIGKPEKKKQPRQRSEIMQLLTALVIAILCKIPIIRDRINRDDKTEVVITKVDSTIPAPEIAKDERNTDDLFLPPVEGQSKEGQNKAVGKEEPAVNPQTAKTDKESQHSAHPSKPISETRQSTKTGATEPERKPSVKAALAKSAARIKEEKSNQRQSPQQTTHKQPNRNWRKKSKSKGR